jgi:hypothetical protein
MKTICIVAIALFFLSIPPKTFGQTADFTQVGTWSCSIPPNQGLGAFTCPSVSFPQEFGGVPNVIITGCASARGMVPYQCLGPDLLPLQSVTSQSFTAASLLGGFGGPQGHANRTISGTWMAVGSRLFRNTAVAKYLVLTVVYAPPGTNGGHSSSSVSYAAGSTTGTTTSASQSFKASNSLSFEGSGGFLGNGGGVGLSFENANSTTDSQSIEIKKSTTSTINRTGPSQDGINHDEDAIYLLLNPTINLAVSPSSASWLLANTSSAIQYVYVGWLNGHVPMPAPIAAALQTANIIAADYPDILARDPLANGSAILDANRYIALNTTFPYEPPYASTDPVPTITTNISDSSTSTTGSAVEDTYKVGLTISATGGFLDFAKATLKDTASWEWTNKSSVSSASGTSQSASVTVGGPAFGYTGPTVLRVYVDTIYHTFAFAVVPVEQEQVALKGVVLNAAGTPQPGVEVVVTENHTEHRVFTNARGQYAYVGSITGAATVRALGSTQSVPPANPIRAFDLRIP